MNRFAGRLILARIVVLLGLVVVQAAGLSGGRGAQAADKSAHPLARLSAGSDAKVDHAAFDALLKAYVVERPDGINRVDYAGFRSSGLQGLKAYLAVLQRTDPTMLGAAEHAAYFINLYNALTLDVVLEHYPVNSIKEVRLADAKGEVQDGPWKTRLAVVNRHGVSLDEIAGEILRPTLMKRDPRGHYLLNCLSIGCPNLLREAMTGEKLEAQMAAAASAFVRHSRGLSVDGGRAKASSLYSWYEDDFGGPRGVVAHMIAVGGSEIAGKLAGVVAITEHDYDWGLADAAR